MGRVKGSGRGRPLTYRKGYYFYSPQSSTVIKSNMAATTRTTFSPTQNMPALQARVDLVLIQPFLLYYVNHVFFMQTGIF